MECIVTADMHVDYNTIYIAKHDISFNINCMH